jgi:hypothetical protein
LPFFLCKATALPHQKEQKSLENLSLSGALQFSRSRFGLRRDAARREYFRIFKGCNEVSAQISP